MGILADFFDFFGDYRGLRFLRGKEGQLSSGKAQAGQHFATTPSVMADREGMPMSDDKLLMGDTERLEKIKAYVEMAADGVFALNLQGKFTFVNPAAVRLSGYAEEELMGKHFRELLPLTYLPACLNVFQRALRGNETPPIEIELITKDKQRRPLELLGRPIRKQGKVVEIVGVARDITERKRAEEALRESAEKHRHLVENLNDVIYSVDRRGMISYVSPAVESLIAYTPPEIIGHWIEDFVYQEDLPHARESVRRVLSGHSTEASEYRILTKSGEIRSIRASSRPIFDDGRVTGLQGVLSDITELKQAEEDVKRRNEQLEALRQTTMDITGMLELPQLLHSIMERAVALVGTQSGGLYLYYPDEEELELVVSYYLDKDYTGTRLKVGEGLSGKVIQTGEPLAIEDYARWEGRSEKFDEVPIRGIMGVPLKWRERIIGVLNVTDTKQPRAFAAHEQRLLELFSSQAAIAIENARLYDEAQHRVRESELLRTASETVVSTLDVTEVLERIAEQMCVALDGTSAYICTYDQETNQSTSLAEYLSPEACPKERASDLGQTYEEVDTEFLATMQSNQHYIDHVDDPDLPESDQDHMMWYGAQSILYIPLWIRERIIGYAEVWESRSRREFTHEEIALCQSIAQSAAIALENARLYEEAQQELVERKETEDELQKYRDHLQELVYERTTKLRTINEEQMRMLSQMEALHQTTLDITRRLDLAQVLGFIMKTAQELVRNSDKAVIHLLDPESLALVPMFPHDLESHPLGRIRMSAKDGIAGLVSQEKRSIYVPDTREDPRYLDLGSGLRSLLVAPLLIGSKVIGTLSVNSAQVDAFNREDERLLAMLANQAAIAIENARLYERLRESEERYRTYVENVLEAIWETDAEGRFTYWSPQVGELVGYAPEELLGHTPYEFMVHPDDVDKLQKELRQILLQKGEQFTLIHRALHRDGSIPYMEISCKPVWSDAGRVIAYRGVARDVSERVLLQAQLMQGEKMSALGRLGASIAHEINNPLQSVQSCLTLLGEELDYGQREDAIKSYLDVAGNEVQRISDIVKQMRDYYRPTQERLQPTDVCEVLECVLELSGKQLEHGEVTVERDWGVDLPMIEANPNHLKQVFLNLVLNATDAMPTGGTLRVRTAPDKIQAPSGQELPAVRIEFIDTGEGIPPEILPDIFEPFFSTKQDGSGLGLSISYGIIESHNGQITATSQVGVGTTFTILLPVEQP